MISCRERVKPLIIIFKEANPAQIKNYTGLAVFPFFASYSGQDSGLTDFSGIKISTC